MDFSSESPDKETLQQEPSNENQRIASDLLSGFLKELDAFQTTEEKIAFGLSYMREAISQEGSARFREFWESRRVVLPLFKENINSLARAKLWEEYIELTQEARRLKEILEEQSSFAIEQIDLAIGAVEKDLEQIDQQLSHVERVKISPIPYSLRSNIASYENRQKELNVLNAFASRLNGLRKEIVRTEMRIRFKTKFFKRLSNLGDLIFPRRKKQIEEMSSMFDKDVDRFITKHFKGDEVVGAPFYALREEIKAFQSMAKTVTLNSSIFSRTRLLLSECWDKIKVLDKEHKKVLLEKKQASSEALGKFREKVDALKERSLEMALGDLDNEIKEIELEMKEIYIDRDDMRLLKGSFDQMREPHLRAHEKKMRELEEAEKASLRLKKEKSAALKERIFSLSQDGESMALEALEAELRSIDEEMKALEYCKAERKQMDNLLRPIRDFMIDKKEISLMNLSDDDLKKLENYRTVLEQKRQRRAKIKDQMDFCRKALGASGLDFEKSLQLNEQLDQEKERFDKATVGIEELEQKILELES